MGRVPRPAAVSPALRQMVVFWFALAALLARSKRGARGSGAVGLRAARVKRQGYAPLAPHPCVTGASARHQRAADYRFSVSKGRLLLQTFLLSVLGEACEATRLVVLLGVFQSVSKRETPEKPRSQERVGTDVNGGEGRRKGPSCSRAVPHAHFYLLPDAVAFSTQLSIIMCDTTPMSPGAPQSMTIA